MATATLGGPLHAAAQTPAVAAELKRGFAAAGTSASDEPALRAEAHPSEPYRIGAAVGAWSNAKAALDFLMKNPSGDGDDDDAIDMDCYDERHAFDHLEASRKAAAVTPEQVAAGIGGLNGQVIPDWTKRQAGPIPRCR